MMINTPPRPHQDIITQDVAIEKKQRSSNLELYRIFCMLMIVAHHFVVNSGLGGPEGVLMSNPESPNSLYLLLFGAWGKTGINCFVLITGYFMCKSNITIKKYIKLLSQIYLYKIIIFLLFLCFGYETVSFLRIIKLALPFWGFDSGFVECFVVFYLTIPFLNILVHNMKKRQHLLLLVLLLSAYTIFGSIPNFDVNYNYITWFGIIYFISSYIRLYPMPIFNQRSFWGWMTLISIVLSLASIVVVNHFSSHSSINQTHFFVSDCNKFFAVTVAVCSFLWFKNMNIKYSKVINAFGAATFGVLLIHANSNAMRTWLWKDTVDVVGHYSLPLGHLVLFSIGVVLAIFLICNIIDQLRIATLEKWFFKWYDQKLSVKADIFINKIISNKP